MEWTVIGDVIEWRGPAPYYFLPMDPEDSAEVKIEAAGLEYWGQVAVIAAIDGSTFTTALFPKDGRYLLPLRASVREDHDIESGSALTVTLRLNRDR
ncbi:DUF1905 domain-containing protein [Janibacter sp. G56]|uniref:DUF1905 domain-containing protein n=1 Tax=Janibacter sp. G56 TaxID=3418717 RepID=UPI003CFEBCB8